MASKRIKIRVKKQNKNRAQGEGSIYWPAAQRWLATGTLVAYSAVGAGKTAMAQQPAGPAGAPDQNRSLAVVRFDIPAGPLSEVVRAFEAATSVRVTTAEAGILLLSSPGVSGPLTTETALKQLLRGTGVAFRFDGPSAVTLSLQARSETLEVAERVTQLSSVKYTSPIKDIPQTISIIPRAVIEQQGATTLRDVLRNVPGLTMTAGEGGTPAGDNMTVRGFSARNDIFVDGVRDLSPQSRDPFNMEQVEVTKGPTSAVSGRGSAGGTLNLVSKAPSMMRILGGSFALGNASTRRATADVNTPVKLLGERTALRTNLLWHDSGIPGRDVVKNNRWGVAPSLAFGLGTPTRVTLSYYKLRQDNISDYGIPWVPATNNALVAYRDQPAPVPRNTFYGFKDRDGESLNQDTGTLKLEHDFTDGITFRSQLRFGRAVRNSVATPPRFAGNDSTAIAREMRSWLAIDRMWDSQTDLRANFKSGGLQHALVVGAAFTNENNVRRNRTAPNSLTTLLNPNPGDVYTGVVTTSPFTGNITGNTQGIYAFDTVKFGQKLEATGGARWERFDVNGVSTTPSPVAQTVKMTSVRAGLVYKPVRAGNFYASYGSSLSPSLEGLSYSTANTSIPPEKTYTVEGGTKWDVMGQRLLLTGAIFQVSKDNARTPGILPTDPPQILAGTQVSRGVELSASGAVTSKIRVLAAYTFMNGRIQSSNNPLEVGRFFINSPRNSASIWATYTARKFTLGAGPRFVGERYGNNTNTRKVDSYWTFDAMGSYAVNSRLDLRVNLSNINDAYYFDRLGGGHVIPGPSRSVLVSTNFRF